MSKDLEEIKCIVAIHFGALGFLNPSENEQILKDRDKVLNALNHLESIDNANPSEALETLKDMLIGNGVNDNINDYVDNLILPIKQALLKAQFLEEEYNNLMEDKDNLESELFKITAPKQYLKWEDLEFKEEEYSYSNVKLGNASLKMSCYLYKGCMKKVWLRNNIICFELKDIEADKQFFNDLHLERVEE